MNIVDKICFNGNLYPANTPLLGKDNRAFRFGDSLFETIHANGTEIQFLNEHLARLTKGMETISMIIPPNFRERLKKEIAYLININKAFSGTRIRLTVFRNNGGMYTPTDNTISYLIETSALEYDQYNLNKKGLRIGIYDEMRKSFNLISQYKTGNSLPFILAGNFCTKMNWDDCLLLNERGNIVESISSNVFIVKNGVLMTPSIESGAVNGIMREQIIEAALRLNLTVFEDCILKPEQLLDAEEIFLSNAISGIRWVVALHDRRYFNKTSKQLIEELNRYTFSTKEG